MEVKVLRPTPQIEPLRRGRVNLSAVVLAAGEGTRMRSKRAKPLAKLCGKTMLGHVLDSLTGLEGLSRVVVVVGHQEEAVRASLASYSRAGVDIIFVKQEHLRGTGDALSVALTRLPDPLGTPDGTRESIIVVPSDTPLLKTATLQGLVEEHLAAKSAVTLLTAELQNPWGYGRIVRDHHGVVKQVVEERDASDKEREIAEINTSCYVFDIAVVAPSLRRLEPTNSQGEYYLTDVVGVLSSAGYNIGTVSIDDFTEVMGVNDRVQLAEAERVMRSRINLSWMRRGVTIVDPTSTYIDSEVEIGPDTTIWPQSLLAGATAIGSNCEIGPEARLVDCAVGDGAKVVRVEAEGAYVGDLARVGPYVSLLPGAKVDAGARIGPFVVME